MLTIKVRDLNQRTAQVLDLITASNNPALVTKNGVAHWQITPIQPGSVSRLEALIQSGLATKPQADLPLPDGPIPVPSGRTVAELLDSIDEDD